MSTKTNNTEIYLDDVLRLSVEVSLADLIPLDGGAAWVGFTGATGGGSQTVDILNWSFETHVTR